MTPSPSVVPDVTPRRRPTRLWWPVMLYMALIFGLSSTPGLSGPPGVDDKTEHFVAYAGLALLTLRAMSGGALAGVTREAVLASWVIATAYGATDEFHQGFVPGRTKDILDLRADAIGAGVSVVSAWAFGIIARSRRPRGAPQTPP